MDSTRVLSTASTPPPPGSERVSRGVFGFAGGYCDAFFRSSGRFRPEDQGLHDIWRNAEVTDNRVGPRGADGIPADTSAAAQLDREPRGRPYADVPFYDAGSDRFVILSRYAHCSEVLVERNPALTPYWVCKCASQYALDPALIAHYSNTVHSFMVVAALLLSGALDTLKEVPVFESHPELEDPYLYLNAFAVMLLAACILLGIMIYENVLRRPYTDMDALIMINEYWSWYLCWCLTLMLGTTAEVAAWCVRAAGTWPGGPSTFFSTICTLFMVFWIYAGWATTAHTSRLQGWRTQQFLDTFCDQTKGGRGLLKEEWLAWLVQQRKGREQ
eukprot:g4423.t1